MWNPLNDTNETSEVIQKPVKGKSSHHFRSLYTQTFRCALATWPASGIKPLI